MTPSVLVRRAACALGFALLLTGPAPAAEKKPGWPFVPLAAPPVPAVRQSTWVKQPLDAFVLAPLEAANLQPTPAADRLTLLRRVTYDLTGLAPTPDEIAAFLADTAPDAYERVVDRLLRSSHFGERWAQHWLDVVRYAETEGYKVDLYRPNAYRYRDWVIRAINADLPFDRFVQLQLAGDELAPDDPDAWVATGFLRLHAEESNGTNYRQIRQDILDNVTDVTGLAFLGLTLECARCHKHKFDPIPQADYYRLQAFFAGLYQKDDVPLVKSAAERAAYEKKLEAWKRATAAIRAEMEVLLEPVRKESFVENIAALDDESQAALKTPPEQRTPLQRQVALLAGKQVERRLNRCYMRLTGAKWDRFDALRKQLAAFDHLKPAALDTAMAVVDVCPTPPATFRLGGGSPLRPQEEVEPGFPRAIDPEAPTIEPAANTSGRRAALAKWLTKPDHPLTSRVIVNRLWQHHFGKGIVATPNDFGKAGDAPTHPALLDHLATQLVAHGWSLKAIHRQIVTSATYRQSSAKEANPTFAAAEKADPANKLLWHARVRRRDGESLRDVLLQAAGQLNPRMFGPSALPELPSPVSESRYAWSPDAKVEDRNRRSVYVYARRNQPLPILAAFDLPDRVNSCPSRACTVNAPQALAMLNGELALTQARHFAGRLLATHGDDTASLIRAAYRTALTRDPDAAERTAAEAFLRQQRKLIAAGGGRADGTHAEAVVDFCHALMNTAEFLYIE